MTDFKTLEFVEVISAPVKQVYAAFSSSIALESWFADFAEVVLSEGNRFYCWWDVGYYATGIFTKIIENEQIALTWNGLGEPHETQVDIFFTAREDATEVRIEHGDIGSGSEWTERVIAYEKGWRTGLANLKSVMETGLDKRIYDTPMLGIMPGNLVDGEIAAKQKLPVSFGVILQGTVPGLGAEAAGLQRDDIVTSLNKHELKTYQDFTPALANCKAGDVVEVIFYREGKKHTISMELSRRQVPDTPASAVELGEAAAKIYAEVAAEREAIFEGVSEEEAAARPGKDEWSAKEVLVHLLYTERWLHLSISCRVSGQRSGGFVNQLELIAAIANTYTLAELLFELKRSEQVTVASIKALPDDFVTDKRKFLGFAYGPGQGFAIHTRLHYDQIKAAIEAARA
jgi:uncharacterized protein YndB with AHSA1/START domain